VLNGRMTVNSELGSMWKEVLWPILSYYLSIFVEGLRKTSYNPSEDSQPTYQEVSLRSPRYEVGALITQLQHPVQDVSGQEASTDETFR